MFLRQNQWKIDLKDQDEVLVAETGAETGDSAEEDSDYSVKFFIFLFLVNFLKT